MDPSRVMVGQQAVVLVDNVPGETSVLLLNRGLFPVYVGGPYVDGPGTGVPLAPLGSLAVTADRPWYAVAGAAAQGAAQAVYRVPGGTSYSPAPSEIAAQIQASQLAAQIGAAVPSAGAIGGAVPQPGALATAAFTQGSRAVDSSAVSFNSLAVGGSHVFAIDTALSVEINWHFAVGTAGTARQWGRLLLEWQDSNLNGIASDSFEVVYEPGMNGVSHGGVIRAPALGTQVKVSFINAAAAPALSAGSIATVLFVQSSRPTDRVRYFPGALATGYAGVLAAVSAVSVAAGTISPMMLLEVLSADIDILLYSSAGTSVSASIFRGSSMDASGPFGEGIPLSAAVANRQRVQGIRSHVGVYFRNSGTVTTNVYVLAVAGDS